MTLLCLFTARCQLLSQVLPQLLPQLLPQGLPQLLPQLLPHFSIPAAGEAMVTKDSVSYFLGPDGKPSRKTTLSWSQPPNALVAGRQYVAALLPGGVEVKSISRAGAAAAEQARMILVCALICS
jgi:hypothetical protein